MNLSLSHPEFVIFEFKNYLLPPLFLIPPPENPDDLEVGAVYARILFENPDDLEVGAVLYERPPPEDPYDLEVGAVLYERPPPEDPDDLEGAEVVRLSLDNVCCCDWVLCGCVELALSAVELRRL